MKTIESVRNIITTQSVESFRAVLKAMRSNVEQLDTIQSETVRDGGKVSDSVRSYIKAVGLDAAVATVATLVNRDAWDGRISSRNSEWAASVEDAWDEEAATQWSIYSKMHKAHLDQFATELRMHGAEYAAEIEAEEAKAAEVEQKAKTVARANDLIEKTRSYISVLETGRSAWHKGVVTYADELLDELAEAICGGWVELDDMASSKLVDRALLNGAANWKEYSWGGCSLIYDSDIAERLCTPSELKKTRHGERRPNSREEWLDTQARALSQAAGMIRRNIGMAIRAQLREDVA
jgi:hypothetical protein